MRLARGLLLVLVPLLVIAGACGSSGDDSDDDAGSLLGSSGPAKNGAGPTSPPGSKEGDHRKPVRDGSLTGKVKVEITGDKTVRLELDGGGIAMGNTAFLTFGESTSVVVMSVGGATGGETGGLAITAENLSTAGDWGGACEVSLDDTPAELKGEFTCKNINAVTPGSTKVSKITVKGTFTLARE